ncbi:radical SAM protein [bacterium]|nr:radical SAM protein [bacterium]
MKTGSETFPLMVLPQVSNVCNSNCVHCWFAENPKLRQRDGVRFMRGQLLRKIIDEIAAHTDPKPLMRITGAGEPFLMPGLTDILVYAAGEKNVRVGVITNGSLLTPDISHRLIDAGVEALEISADASDRESYERIRRGLSFDVLLGNIGSMLDYRDKTGGKTKIIVSFVENPDEIDPDAVEDYWRKKVDNVIRRKYLTYGQISEDKYSAETYLPPENRVPCPYPFERMVILASGYVTFCNFDVADSLYMGNVNSRTIGEIWRSEKFEALRALILGGRYEEMPLCAKCNDWKYKSWKYNYFKVLNDTETNEQ